MGDCIYLVVIIVVQYKKMKKHKWEKVDLPDNLKTDFKAKHICTRGDCKCERLTGRYDSIYIYERYGQIYDTAPDCYGDIPVNDQTID